MSIIGSNFKPEFWYMGLLLALFRFLLVLASFGMLVPGSSELVRWSSYGHVDPDTLHPQHHSVMDLFVLMIQLMVQVSSEHFGYACLTLAFAADTLGAIQVRHREQARRTVHLNFDRHVRFPHAFGRLDEHRYKSNRSPLIRDQHV